jgi:hypothetical protein
MTTTTDITVENLLQHCYLEYSVPRFDKYDRLFQRAITGDCGEIKYFLTFRSWPDSFDAEVNARTDTDGDVWITIRELTIQATETRAELLWKAAGAVNYE